MQERYRGYSSKDKTCYYGDLVGENIIVSFFEIAKLLPYEALTQCKCDCHKVDKESIGRFIEKYDNTNKPIYEGDIFKFKFMEEPNKPIELIGSFAWNDEDLRYEIDIYSNEYPEYICLYYIGNGQMYDFEIIGNIFDNAEPLNK